MSKSIFRLRYHNHYFIWVGKYFEKETFQSGVLFRFLSAAFPLAKRRWPVLCPLCLKCLPLPHHLAIPVAQICQISSLRNSHQPSDPGSSQQTVLGNEATNPIPYCSASLLFRLSCSVSSAHGWVPWETPSDCPRWGTCVRTDTARGACAATGPLVAAPPGGSCQKEAAWGTRAARPGNLLPWHGHRRTHRRPPRLTPWLSLGLMLPAPLQLPATITVVCRTTAHLADLSHIGGTAKQMFKFYLFLYTWVHL